MFKVVEPNFKDLYNLFQHT